MHEAVTNSKQCRLLLIEKCQVFNSILVFMYVVEFTETVNYY